ncbi:AMP-binding protein [Alteromonas sp. H39]|uniref:AMP-binding protein n=1 Tax=Alteromonas sp. H39 TaxID=3389876 RepID=UPI0039E0EDAD
MIDWVDALGSRGEQVALNVDGATVTYAMLEEKAKQTQSRLLRLLENTLSADSPGKKQRPLVLLQMENSLSGVVYYLTCLRAQWPVILVNPQMSEEGLAQLKASFLPNLVLSDSSESVGYTQWHRLTGELALVLLTSGSTGGGKAVSLSYTNIRENTRSICQYLPIRQNDITLASMPFSYSYGLSVLNTHLASGASVAITKLTLMDKGFWDLMESLPVNSLAGVPHWYEMLIRLRFTQRNLPALRYFTQAGGRLSAQTIQALTEFADNNNSQFFRMYGQTEATARMAWLHPQRAGKPDAIGQAIPGGTLYLEDEEGRPITEPGIAGELCYSGPNCMLGYAGDVGDLASFGEYGDLKTGDLACLDEDGDYRIVGRKKRIIKLLGERINLDGLESLFAAKALEVKCFGDDSRLHICCFEHGLGQVQALVREWIRCPPKFYCVHVVDTWPLLPNGKTDYQQLASVAHSAGFR